MLFVLIEVGSERYAIEASRIAEVLPLVHVSRLAQAPPGVAGLFNYRGAAVPVIDLSMLMLGRPAVPRFSTRLLLVRDADDDGKSRLLAFVAEHATATLRREAADFRPSGISSNHTAYLGSVATDARGVIQWIDLVRILPAAVRDALFKEHVDS